MPILDLSRLGEKPPVREPFEGVYQAQFNHALELAAQVEDAEAAHAAIWLHENSEVVSVFADRQGQPRLPESNKALRVTFIGDNNPVLRWYPEMRYLPMYADNLKAISLPIETASNPVVLGAISVHETIHAFNSADPDFETNAHEVFPETTADQAVRLVTEIKAFEVEGKVLSSLLGKSFDDYIQSEVDAADKMAIDNQEANRGLLIETGVNREAVMEALSSVASFNTRSAEEFCVDAMATAVPLFAGFRAVDQVFDRNERSEAEKMTAKAMLVGQISEYIY